MTFIPPRDRVLERSTSNSQTVFAVTGALDTSFNRFSASMGVGDTTIGGVVERGVAFKSGILTYSASNEITVTTTKESKGTFSSGGIKEVFMGAPALAMLMVDGAQALSSTQQRQARENISVPLKGHLFGLTVSTAGSSATFGVASGESADSTGVDLLQLLSAYTKTTAAWAVGTGNGSFDGTGSAPSATAGSYHVFLIKRPDTGVVDILTSNSATAPTLPANYTLYRRIWSMKTNGSFQWIKFVQLGDRCLLDVPVATAYVASATAGLKVLGGVPTGIKVSPLFTFLTTGSGETVYFSSPDTSDQAASNGLGSIRLSATGQVPFNNSIWTDTSAQIRVRADGTLGSGDSINVQGWIDDRGRLY